MELEAFLHPAPFSFLITSHEQYIPEQIQHISKTIIELKRNN